MSRAKSPNITSRRALLVGAPAAAAGALAAGTAVNAAAAAMTRPAEVDPVFAVIAPKVPSENIWGRSERKSKPRRRCCGSPRCWAQATRLRGGIRPCGNFVPALRLIRLESSRRQPRRSLLSVRRTLLAAWCWRNLGHGAVVPVRDREAVPWCAFELWDATRPFARSTVELCSDGFIDGCSHTASRI
jgi:hypothetical protein